MSFNKEECIVQIQKGIEVQKENIVEACNCFQRAYQLNPFNKEVNVDWNLISTLRTRSINNSPSKNSNGGMRNIKKYRENKKEEKEAQKEWDSKVEERKAKQSKMSMIEPSIHDAEDQAADIDVIVHLAAQAGVRYSLQNPHAYVDSNIVGFMNVLEGCRHHGVQHLVYASSSSV